VLEKIGEGGMGSLYLARDPAIDRLVAIKLLRRGFDTEAVRERFTREARAAGRLRHPNIVTIFDVGEHDGDPFIAMEFLAGETLGELIRNGARLSLSRKLKLLEELCDGLAYAHRAGLVHRDVKPANLMVDAEGVLKILDFGIVRVGDSGMTQAGVLVGTINYMAPEQVLGTGVDHRSDIFAVGLVAYELLSGRQAFVGTMKDGLLRRIPNVEIELLPNVVSGLDPDVVAIVEQALKKEPADRYQELARMRNDLTRARQRIEVQEERAAIEAASASAETALIAEEPTAPGVPTGSGQRPGSELLAAAERALSQGNYRYALSIAGRAAALDPQDRTPSAIVARAEAGLLERGRTFEAATPQQVGTPPAATPPAAPAPASSATGTSPQAQRITYLAIAVAVIALAVAGFAVWSQLGQAGPEEGQGQVARLEPGANAPGQETPATQSGAPSQPTASNAANGGQGTPPSAAEPPALAAGAEAGGARTSSPAVEPERTKELPQSSARNPSREGGNRGGSQRAGSDAGRSPRSQPAEPQRNVPTAPAPQPPAVQPANQPERQETQPVTTFRLPEAGRPPTLPGQAAPRPASPPPPPAAKPADKVSENKPEPPRRDPRAEAEAGVRAALQRYEAAWEALNFDALSRVLQTSADGARELRNRMGQMREYQMDMTIQRINISDDNRTATAECRVAYRFQGRVAGRQNATVNQTFMLERRGETWMIIGLR
jgi:serine/threonine-protein kinase